LSAENLSTEKADATRAEQEEAINVALYELLTELYG
jgi:hypothetical protein